MRAQIRNMARNPPNSQSVKSLFFEGIFGIVSIEKARISAYRLNRYFVKGYGPWPCCIGSSKYDNIISEVGIIHRKLKRLHPAHRSADNRPKMINSQIREQMHLCPDHIFDRHNRKFQTIECLRGIIFTHRAGRTEAASDHIGRDNKIVARIDCLAVTDQSIPPARLIIALIESRCMV